MDKLVKMVLMMLAEMQLTQRVSRFSGAAKWLALASICGIGAGVALVAALWLYLIPRIGSDAAALSMGVLLAALSGLFALVARATLHPHKTSHVNHDANDETIAELKDMFAKHKGTALLSAVVAGIAMASGRK
ncbi:MAG: phage holin family protein [Proteobacteria bacterium]|nr:phage holin family protein [Pseudomonadota bacterium]